MSDVIQAAGTMFVAPNERVLFVRRSGAGDHGGEWAFPGGRIEDGESAEEAARREASEELGDYPEETATGDAELVHQHVHDGVDFTTFKRPVRDQFSPTLEGEHDAHAWATPDNPPSPLHPGVRATLDNLNGRFDWKEGMLDVIQPDEKRPAPVPEEEIDEDEVKPTYEVEISE